jgi:hypothetical protein
MYETKHTDGITKGKINYTVWSDVFTCPECAGEVVFWEAAVDKQAGKVQDEFPCPHCKAALTKRKMDRAWTTKYDSALNESVRQAKQVPVLINYTVDGTKRRFEKTPDEHDLDLINKVENSAIPYWFPIDKLPEGDKTGEPSRIGITHVHHFYTKRNVWVLAAVFNRAISNKNPRLVTWVTSSMIRTTKMYKYMPSLRKGKLIDRRTGTLSGTLYFPSMSDENSPFDLLKSKVGDYGFHLNDQIAVIESISAENVHIPKNVDYIFIDPPFGANLNYSELNFLWEAWIKVFTNNKSEAIESISQGKYSIDYRRLMGKSFTEAYRILKPGRWMTVEFSNTKASVWNSIQTAISEAGFIIANVAALNKKQGSYNAVTNPTSVKQDLVISAYKPNGGFEERFQKEAKTEEGVWDFIHTHLQYLPVTKLQGTELVVIPERDPRILYDQVITYYMRKRYDIPIDSQDFQVGLSQRFSERDGMYFLPEQVAEYDQKKMRFGNKVVLQSLFISDEASAIEWLRSLLREKPQSYQDINPQFMKEISGWSKNETGLELSILLEQNFLVYDGAGPVPEQIHSYLSTNWKEMRNLSKQDPALVAKAKGRWYVPDPSKAGDLEKLRERALLKEFEQYKQLNKKLKVFRLEAVRTGFKKAWQDRDYKTIVSVAEKIPSSVLEEDPKLLMWYDQAMTRLGD